MHEDWEISEEYHAPEKDDANGLNYQVTCDYLYFRDADLLKQPLCGKFNFL